MDDQKPRRSKNQAKRGKVFVNEDDDDYMNEYGDDDDDDDEQEQQDLRAYPRAKKSISNMIGDESPERTFKPRQTSIHGVVGEGGRARTMANEGFKSAIERGILGNQSGKGRYSITSNSDIELDDEQLQHFIRNLK